MLGGAKIQLCGKLTIVIGGQRVEDMLPGRQGRLLFAFLVVNRNRTLVRSLLLDALWPDGQGGGLAPLLSKLRRVAPLEGYRIALPADTWVDIEAAAEAVHRAESALAQGNFHDAWGPAQVAMFVSGRPFLPDADLAWVSDVRRTLDDLYLRALEAYARAGLGIGGTELPAAVRVGRVLIARDPYRERDIACLWRRSRAKATKPKHFAFMRSFAGGCVMSLGSRRAFNHKSCIGSFCARGARQVRTNSAPRALASKAAALHHAGADAAGDFPSIPEPSRLIIVVAESYFRLLLINPADIRL